MMKLFTLLYVLYKVQLLSPTSIYRLTVAVYKNGLNLMTLLHFAKMKYGDQIALVDDEEIITYRQLFNHSQQLAFCFMDKYHLQKGQKVGFLSKNHAALVKAIFAVSRIGADVYLLNAETSKGQFNSMVQRHRFDLLIHDSELNDFVDESIYKNGRIFTYHDQLPAINSLQHMATNEKHPLKRSSASKLVLQTSGTTGLSKDAAHKPSLFNYLNPFIAFIHRLKILTYKTAYIATPIYHGYGIAVLLLFIPLGKKAVISKGFHAEKACKVIRDHHVEVVTVVPLMLQKMLQCHPEDLTSLSCIASGGARLPVKLIEQSYEKLGNVLYNLYGTSETGLNFIAIPEDLRIAPTTIGKKINGLKIKVLGEDMTEVENGKVGQLSVKNDWSIANRNNNWIKTGDLVYRDENGYYFVCGRTDDMVISGGENVYPVEVEQELIKHPFIEDVAIIGIDDEHFGQRLKAFVLPVENVEITEEQLLEWLRPRVARFQLPKEVKFVDEMPYSSLGKLDRKQFMSTLIESSS
ncbi:AMP-binding protein [Evansella sp. AB-P1]|uniref:AMP-binding protein n=1 Tax=Evansella sp. AB-P1 TaxID=3037653 RepID=UPI00241FB101|nr:AMP-binding protein [Evansella sp. AB-P1]MDG5788900.1 AMP-binding protein [Evansella sp. AB-P1]